MPTYIALLKWTPQGLQSVKESPSRLDAARKSFEVAGVKMKDFYMVTGRYDMIAICEAPDDKDDRKGACSGNFFPVDQEFDILPTAYAHFGMAAEGLREIL